MNALRLALAFLVMLSHAFALSYGSADSDPLKRFTAGQETFGSLAVNLFFLISGMLITASWFRSRSMNDYLIRRVLRIYPGYIVALVFSALLPRVVCPESRPHLGDLSALLHDLLRDAVLLDQKSLDGPAMFALNPWPGSSNGSVWTIQTEFRCYILVAIIGLFCLYKRRLILLVSTAALSAVFVRGLLYAPPVWGPLHVNGSEQLISRFYSYFLVGMLVWLFRDKIRFSWVIALTSLVALLAAARFAPAFSILFLVAGSYLALNVGLTQPWRLTRWTQKTDISYGVYLYAWPVQQLVAMHPGLRSAFLNLLISIPITVILALLSWHVVEHRFLKMKSMRLADYDPATAQ